MSILHYVAPGVIAAFITVCIGVFFGVDTEDIKVRRALGIIWLCLWCILQVFFPPVAFGAPLQGICPTAPCTQLFFPWLLGQPFHFVALLAMFSGLWAFVGFKIAGVETRGRQGIIRLILVGLPLYLIFGAIYYQLQLGGF